MDGFKVVQVQVREKPPLSLKRLFVETSHCTRKLGSGAGEDVIVFVFSLFLSTSFWKCWLAMLEETQLLPLGACISHRIT